MPMVERHAGIGLGQTHFLEARAVTPTRRRHFEHVAVEEAGGAALDFDVTPSNGPSKRMPRRRLPPRLGPRPPHLWGARLCR